VVNNEQLGHPDGHIRQWLRILPNMPIIIVKLNHPEKLNFHHPNNLDKALLKYRVIEKTGVPYINVAIRL
jgi:hypothetical protein